ncbi:MAG: cysteine desulfurase [Spirochaetes bacterium]|nr:cysteine desulfurase [Spirochaetota bacterium]
MIYLDYAATTPVLPEVAGAIREAMENHWGNPSSLHPIGQGAGRLLRQSRSRIAAALGVGPTEILFCSCGSEANNWALDGILSAHPDVRTLITSRLEHPSVFAKAEALAKEDPGLRLHFLPVSGEGRVLLDGLPDLLASGPALVSLMLVNNETGVLQPVAEAVAMARRAPHPVFVHVDAVQALGKLALDLKGLDADLVSFGGHKIGAPKGAAFLYKKPGLELGRLIEGGGQELGLRGGTENTPYLAGLAVAVERAVLEAPAFAQRCERLQAILLEKLLAIPGVVLNGDPAGNSRAIVNFSVPGTQSDIMQIRLGDGGLCISGGAACASGARRPSRILLAMGLEAKRIESSLRVSFGPATTEAEVLDGARILGEVAAAVRGA